VICQAEAKWFISYDKGDPLSTFACDKHKDILTGDGASAVAEPTGHGLKCCYLPSEDGPDAD
jgi:hypothetical protein